MSGTVLTLGIQCEQVEKTSPSGSLLHRQVFSNIVLCFFFFFLISNPLIPVQKSLQSWPSKGPPVDCFAVQLKSTHILECQQKLHSCTTQQSCEWNQISTTRHHAGSKQNEFYLISRARMWYLLPKWLQHSSPHGIRALACSAFTLNQGRFVRPTEYGRSHTV